VLFNSLAFAIFLPVVFVLYWYADRERPGAQNALVLAASYVFYGWWDARFLALIVASTAVDYAVGLGLGRAREKRARQLLLGVSLACNLGLLGFFKYYDFFLLSAQSGLGALGIPYVPQLLRVILPVGISFYTFQTLSYSIDVYRKQIEPTRDFVAFAAYVSFFPQLVAGPIERAHSLLPQFLVRRTFDMEKAKDGLRQIAWGLFKKMVVADRVASSVDYVFANYTSLDGGHALVGTFLFAIQIYCDFSGYSDIAIGTSRLLGFDLMRNFAYPYFSRDISEFWSRWHISLSGWFRDYVYIPLGGGRGGRWSRLRNVMAVFLLSGFWHGANWTYVVWGLIHGLCYVPLVLLGRHRRYHGSIAAEGRLLPRPAEAFAILRTLALVLVAWVFFRADSVGHALDFLAHAVRRPWGAGGLGRYALPLLVSVALLVAEWIQRAHPHALAIAGWPRWARHAVYYGVVLSVVAIGNLNHVQFIYFQF